jgi:hypothetical protein
MRDFLKDYIYFIHFLTDKENYTLSGVCQVLVIIFVMTRLRKYYNKRFEYEKIDRLLFLRLEIRNLFMGNTRNKQLVTLFLFLSIQAKCLVFIFWPHNLYDNLYVLFNNVNTIIILVLMFIFFYNLIKLKNIEFYRAYDNCFPERGLLALNLKSSQESFFIYTFEEAWATQLAKGKEIVNNISTIFQGKVSTERFLKECERGAKSELEKNHYKAQFEALKAENLKVSKEALEISKETLQISKENADYKSLCEESVKVKYELKESQLESAHNKALYEEEKRKNNSWWG